MRLKEFLNSNVGKIDVSDIIKGVSKKQPPAAPPPPKSPTPPKRKGDDGPTGFEWELTGLVLQGKWQGVNVSHLPVPNISLDLVEDEIGIEDATGGVIARFPNYPPMYWLRMNKLKDKRGNDLVAPFVPSSKITNSEMNATTYAKIADELYSHILKTDLGNAENSKYLISKPTAEQLKQLHMNQIKEHEHPGMKVFRSV